MRRCREFPTIYRTRWRAAARYGPGFLTPRALAPRRSGRRRFAAADRHLRDAGVSYRAHGETAERVWPLSHLPLLIDEANGSRSTAGIVQRAELIERVLPTSMARAGWSPKARCPPPPSPAAPISAPPCCGVKPPGGAICSSTPPTSAAGPTGAGGCSATAPRRLPAPATRWRTAWCCRAPSPTSTRR